MSSCVPAKGMRDFLPAELELREAVLSRISERVYSYGFQHIETPILEDIAKLKSKEGGDNESMLFEVLKRGLDSSQPLNYHEAVDLGLRYDLTLPLSRYYAHNHAKLPRVFRAFQTGPVFRAERPQKGRFRQFRQCDIDILGCESWLAELEILSLGWRILKDLGLADDSLILINDRRLLDKLAHSYGVSEDKSTEFFIILDKIEKIGAEAVIKELYQKEVLSLEQAQAVIDALVELGSSDDENRALSALLEDLGCMDLILLINKLKAICPDIKLRFNPHLVRGMGYYTGIVYEVIHKASSSSICGGGRYDKIIGKWLGQTVPAVGFSFGFERILSLLENQQPSRKHKLALAYTSDEDYLDALTLREELFKLQTHYTSIGLTRAPGKLKHTFFENLSETYGAVILPSALKLEAHEALERCKNL